MSKISAYCSFLGTKERCMFHPRSKSFQAKVCPNKPGCRVLGNPRTMMTRARHVLHPTGLYHCDLDVVWDGQCKLNVLIGLVVNYYGLHCPGTTRCHNLRWTCVSRRSKLILSGWDTMNGWTLHGSDLLFQEINGNTWAFPCSGIARKP